MIEDDELRSLPADREFGTNGAPCRFYVDSVEVDGGSRKVEKSALVF